ncbi:phasin family protein [Fretibacter rubidus]|uniref:phasin family protein n=1 Tax=Fretibacter rubidus TaxID=570162 RepID=UPI00352AC98E
MSGTDKNTPDNKASDKREQSESRSTGEAARRILLAGIGAYGRAFMEAQEALKDVRGKSSDVFDELVQKGEMMEMAFEHKSKQVTEQVSKQVRDKASIPNLQLDDRIKKMRSRLMGGTKGALSGDDGFDTESLSTRLDTVEAKLDKVLALLDPPKAKKAAPKKTTATKTVRTVKTEKMPSKTPPKTPKGKKS